MMIDSLTAYAARAYRTNAQPAIDTTAERLAARVELMLTRTRDSLTVAMQQTWAAAIQQIIRSSVSAAGQQSRTELAQLVLLLSERTRIDLQPVLDTTFQLTALHASDTLWTHLGGRTQEPAFRNNLRGLTAQLADTGTTAALSAAGRSDFMQRFGRTFLIGAIVLLIAAGVFLFLQRRQLSRAYASLGSVASTVHDLQAHDVAMEVRERMKKAGLEDWFHKYLAKRKDLI
jgi:hypothetical protein